jgi:transcriptional regulator with XRE-family HTH domain
MRGALQTRRYRQFLKRLKRARTEAGLTQLEAADQLRKPQSFVSKSESGERRVDVIELESFASVYGQPILFFYES